MDGPRGGEGHVKRWGTPAAGKGTAATTVQYRTVSGVSLSLSLSTRVSHEVGRGH